MQLFNYPAKSKCFSKHSLWIQARQATSFLSSVIVNLKYCQITKAITSSMEPSFFFLSCSQEFSLVGKREAFTNTIGRGANASNQHSILFQQCFLPLQQLHSYSDRIVFIVCKYFKFG